VDYPITYSILPHLRHSEPVANAIYSHGHEIMLHQPMEPYNHRLDPGPGAIFVGYENGKIEHLLRSNIDSIPFAIGVNNHMGSRVTERASEMNQVLSVIKSNGLFFVDSLTSNHSVAYKMARELGIPFAYRHVFIDHRPYEDAILNQLLRLESLARKYGRAIGIGHPYPQTARMLAHYLKKRKRQDVSLVYITEVLQC
jgi:polysaccharide deacetylase 2 family uncharacterized protein YibQ